MTGTAPAGRRQLRAGQLMFTGGLGAAAMMDAVVKGNLAAIPLSTLLVFRGLGAAVLIAIVTVMAGRVRRLWPTSWRIVLGQGLLVTVTTALFFWSLNGLSLSMAYVVTYTIPLVLVLLAGVFLKERIGGRAWLLILLGLSGALLAVAPGSLSGQVWYVAAAFAATTLYATSLLVARATRNIEKAEALAFWTLLVVGVAALTAGAALGVPLPSTDQLLPLAAVAVFGAISQSLVILAFRAAPAASLAPFEYTTLPWAVILDLAVWGLLPDLRLAAGSALVLTAAVLASRGKRARRETDSPAGPSTTADR